MSHEPRSKGWCISLFPVFSFFPPHQLWILLADTFCLFLIAWCCCLFSFWLFFRIIGWHGIWRDCSVECICVSLGGVVIFSKHIAVIPPRAFPSSLEHLSWAGKVYFLAGSFQSHRFACFYTATRDSAMLCCCCCCCCCDGAF
jgi:hypothetical protein